MADQTLPNEPQPDEMPDVYASICNGDCLEPTFKDGACLVFDKTQEPENGDFVGIWLHPDAVAPGESTRRIKRLVMGGPPGEKFPMSFAPGSEVQPLIVLEQLNPLKRYHVPGSHILAMHKLVGEAEADGQGCARIVRQVIGGKLYRYQAEG